MNSAVMFIIGVVALTLILHLLVFKQPAKIIRFWKAEENKKIHVGIITFVLVFVVLGILYIPTASAKDNDSIKWFAFGEMYLGVDHTSDISPMCFTGDNNDRITSHGGFRANILQSPDSRFSLNAKYTHHSCAFNQDYLRYDGVGVELVYRLW